MSTLHAYTKGSIAARVYPQRPELRAAPVHEPQNLTEAWATPGVVYTQQAPELHQDVSGQHEPLLLLEVSTIQSLCYSWTSIYYRGLCCTVTCPHPLWPE
jgi:hypothetical protein